jgi:hypothetical protein
MSTQIEMRQIYVELEAGPENTDVVNSTGRKMFRSRIDGHDSSLNMRWRERTKTGRVGIVVRCEHLSLVMPYIEKRMQRVWLTVV